MKNARRVTREEFGDAWPLTVDACWLRRHPHTGALMVQVQRGRARYRVYALNGIAIDQGYRDIRPIHAVAVESPYDGEPYVRKTLRPLIKAAQQIGEEQP